jgi:hypothetical protein
MKKSKIKNLSKIIFLVVCLPSISAAVSIPNESSGNHIEFCKKEWTTRGVLDVNMYEYCLQLEHEGYLNFVSLANQYKDFKWIQLAVNHVVEKNTLRGVRNDSQVNYQLKKITEGFEDIEYTMKQVGYNQQKMESCYINWSIEWDMIYYCYKN